MATGHELHCLTHPDQVFHLSFDPDGKKLATACYDGRVRIWDAERWVVVAESPPYGDEVYCAEFSPDGRRVAYAGGFWRGIAKSRDTSVRIWDLASNEVRPMDGHTHCVLRTLWSPQGDLLASVGRDRQVKLWDPASIRELTTLNTSAGRGTLMSAAFSPDGSRLVAAGTEMLGGAALLEVFDIASRRFLHELPGHAKSLCGVSFAPNGQLIASAAGDDTVKVWSAQPPPTSLSLEGHDQTVWTVAFSPNGKYLATGSLDQTARIWDATTGALVQTIPVNFPVLSMAFSPAGQRLLTTGPGNTACVWRIQALPHLRSSRREEALSGKSGIRNPESEGERSLTSAATGDPPLWLRGHTRPVLAVAWSSDNRWIATGGKDRQAILWDASTGHEQRRLLGHTNWVLALAFATDGKLLATGSEDATVRLWDCASGRCLRVLTNHSRAVLSLAFSPDGRRLASGAEDWTVRLWDTGSWRELRSLHVFVNGPTALAFSPDGRRLATAGSGRSLINWERENRIRLWDVELGQALFAFIAHTNAVYGVAFSPDGRRLATASGDNTARLWTAFPWRSADYPGNPQDPLADRIEEYKRQLWRPAPQPTSDPARRIEVHILGDFNVPAPGTKTQPLFPIPPRDAQASLDQIDLTAAYNVALNESWQPIEDVREVDHSLAAIGPGLQPLAGVPFDVRGLIQLRRLAADCGQFPERALIHIGRTFRRLHALHGARWEVRDHLPIAAFVLHYADGTQAELPVVYGEHVRQEDAGSDPGSGSPYAVVAWRGPPAETPGGWQPRLYRATFDNPHPDREIRQIEYVSRLTQSAPFLVALTVE